MDKTNRWHPVMLPDDYLSKLKQDRAEAEAMVESKTRYEPDPKSYNVVGLRRPLSDSAYGVTSYPNDDRRCTMLPSERDTHPSDDDVPPSGDLAG